MTTPHSFSCEAAICQDDYEPEYVWYPGERVCGKKPYKTFQKVQARFNKILSQNPALADSMFTAKELSDKRRVGKNSFGKHPNTLYRYAVRA